MLQKNDLVLILTEMETNEVEGAHEQLLKLFSTSSSPTETLKFINDRRQLDVTQFYERIRKNYNDHGLCLVPYAKIEQSLCLSLSQDYDKRR